MFRRCPERLAHHLLLIVLTAGLFLPRLGVPGLWDIDEGHNAQCAREMLECGNWVVPTFNYQLRVDKPALLYWLQIAAYLVFGIGEFAARLPSALAAMLTVLLTYELGRRLFDARSGLLAGLALASALLFCGSAHFANPDALLNACTVLTFLVTWTCFQRSDGDWPILAGVSTGIGFLAKGPVALVLPLAVIGLYLLWVGQLRRLLSHKMLWAGLLFGLVAIPWFALVGSETKGDYLRGFFLTHNRDRFLAPMENHNGTVFYHAISLILGFLPWSVFLVPALWDAVRRLRAPTSESPTSPALKLLICWIGVYFVFFSVSQTKLPNYILPLYPPVALLIGRYLELWRCGEIRPRAWVMNWALTCWALVGVGTILALLVAGGTLEAPVVRGHRLPGLEAGALIGLVPLLSAVGAWLLVCNQARGQALASLTVSAALFTGLLIGWGAPALDAHKAPRALVDDAGACQLDHEVQIGCYGWYQPSLVFYCGREVRRLDAEKQAIELLQCPLPAYLFMPAAAWPRLEARVDGSCREVARRWDLYRNCEVIVVTNH